MARYYNLSDDELAFIAESEFDPTKHYKGTDYPDLLPPEGAKVDIFYHYFARPSAMPWLRGWLTGDGYVHSPLTLRDFRQGRVGKMRLGRFLKKYLKFDDSTAEHYTNQLTIGELKFGHTREEFRWVYNHSDSHASSCMTNKSMYRDEDRIHPAEVYAAGDLAIAYTLHKDGSVSNRAVVWPEKKRYSSVYGETVDFMKQLLHAEGYEQNSDFTGARLNFIEHEERSSAIYTPYWDTRGSATLFRDGTFLLGNVEGLPNKWSTIGGSEYGYCTLEKDYCQLTDDYVFAFQLEDTGMHPETGRSFRHKFGLEIDVDDYGYAVTGDPSHYDNETGLPLHLIETTAICCVLGERMQRYEMINDPKLGWISHLGLLQNYRRDFFTGELFPISEMMELTNGCYARDPRIADQALPEGAQRIAA